MRDYLLSIAGLQGYNCFRVKGRAIAVRRPASRARFAGSRIMVKLNAATDQNMIAAAAPAAGLASGGVRLPSDRLLGDTLLLLICP